MKDTKSFGKILVVDDEPHLLDMIVDPSHVRVAVGQKRAILQRLRLGHGPVPQNEQHASMRTISRLARTTQCDLFTILRGTCVRLIPAAKTSRILIASPGEGRICRGVFDVREDTASAGAGYASGCGRENLGPEGVRRPSPKQLGF